MNLSNTSGLHFRKSNELEDSLNYLQPASGSSNLLRKTPRCLIGRIGLFPPPNAVFQEQHDNLRRKSLTRPQIEPFTKFNVPDLVILKIFTKLNKRDLGCAMRACRRFYTLGELSSSWKTIDCTDKRVNEYTLAALMRRKVQTWRLADAKVETVIRIPKELFSFTIQLKSRLMYLDLSRAGLDFRQLQVVLQPCTILTCLSLEGNEINNETSRYIAQNKKLRQIDLSMTTGLTDEGIYIIAKNCTKLEEVNVSWCGMTAKRCDIFCGTVGPELRKLNISGSQRPGGLNDQHISKLVNSCFLLNELDLSDNSDITNISINWVTKLPNIVTLSCSRCYGIDPNVLAGLNHSGIKNLNVHGCVTDSNIDLFKSICNNLVVNSQIFNYIAKPSNSHHMSNRIWGQYLYP